MLVALTGGIGAGKSTVAARLQTKGAVIIDADQIVRDVVAPGTTGLAAVVDRFGQTVLAGDGCLDRAALAEIVFADDGARRDLEAIVQPAATVAFRQRLAGVNVDGNLVVNDVPLFAEAARESMPERYDAVLVVEAPLETRLYRLERRGMDREQASARIAVQASDEQRRAIANYLVDNSGDCAELNVRVDDLWIWLQRRSNEQR
jgi:dephospho-CoA kinase